MNLEKIENIILNEKNGYCTLEDEISENFRRWRLRKNFDSFLELKEYLGFKTELIHMKQRKGGCVDGLKSAGLLISDLILDNINFTNMSNNVISDIDYLLSQQGKTDAIVFETNSISMIGIDHSMAPVDIRALFAFTRKNAGEAMEKLKEQPGIDGCIILSTCNRLEVWASVDDEAELSLYKELCKLKNINDDQYEIYFTKREGHAAVEHLFYLASGLKSQILGEDQILTQVKDALGIAREHFTTDGALEVLFRMAVTAGKKIKTEVPFSHGNPSVIHQAIEMLDRQGYCVQDKVCMVIGNGEMGKVAAQALMEAGADVTVTVRQYRSGMVNIPFGCKRINYGERMDYLPKCDLVVSATASPNFTLR